MLFICDESGILSNLLERGIGIGNSFYFPYISIFEIAF